MHPVFSLQSSDRSSSLVFSNRSQDYFDVVLETPNLKATKKVCIYDYSPNNGFVEFFRRIASHHKPWSGEEIWEPLEGDMKLIATCDTLGHVELHITLRSTGFSLDNWSAECSLPFDFGALPELSSEAAKFISCNPTK